MDSTQQTKRQIMVSTANVQVFQIPELFEQEIGRKPSLSTIKRWIRDGYKGVKLEAPGPAHFRYCNIELVRAFLGKCNKVQTPEMVNSERTEAAMRRSELSDRILRDRFGI